MNFYGESLLQQIIGCPSQTLTSYLSPHNSRMLHSCHYGGSPIHERCTLVSLVYESTFLHIFHHISYVQNARMLSIENAPRNSPLMCMQCCNVWPKNRVKEQLSPARNWFGPSFKSVGAKREIGAWLIFPELEACTILINVGFVSPRGIAQSKKLVRQKPEVNRKKRKTLQLLITACLETSSPWYNIDRADFVQTWKNVYPTC